MPRTFVPITKDELLKKIEEAGVRLTEEGDEPGLRAQVWRLIEYGEFEKDLKVDMDFENFECQAGQGYNGCKGLTGPQCLDNGLSFVGCCAGGDWQVPVFFIVYWDGSKLRAYVPTDGNTWNTDTKTAYGDTARADYANAKKRYPDLVATFDASIAKYEADRKRLNLRDIPGIDHFEFDTTDIPECDPVKILEDIRARLVKKDDAPGSIELPKPADGFKVTRVDDYIFLQPTLQGDVTGHGLMMTRQMAAKVASEIVNLL